MKARARRIMLPYALFVGALLGQPIFAAETTIKTNLQPKSIATSPSVPFKNSSATGPKIPGASGAQNAIPKSDAARKAQQLNEINQARGLQEMKAAGLRPGDIPARDGDLANPTGTGLKRDGGGPFPSTSDIASRAAGAKAIENPLGKFGIDLPSNRSKTPDFGLGTPTDPNSLRSGTNRDGWVDRVSSSRDSNGFTTRETAYRKDNGSFLGSITTHYGNDGLMFVSYLTRTRDVTNQDGSRTTYIIEEWEVRDENNVIISTSRFAERPLGSEGSDPPTTDPGAAGRTVGGINKLIDPNSDRSSGRLCHAMPWTCRGKPRESLHQVNPGNDPNGVAEAPRIGRDKNINVNPSPDARLSSSNSGRKPDPDSVHRTIGPIINPPGPGNN